MKKSNFTETQIVKAIKEHEGDRKAAQLLFLQRSFSKFKYMKNVVTPENFMWVQMVLTSWNAVFTLYNLRTLIIIIAVIQSLLLVFCVGFFLWQSSKELQELKRKVQRTS